MNIENFKLFFTKKDKVILGVCTNIANQFKIPVAAVRIGFIILTLLIYLLGILLYVGLYFVMRNKLGRIVSMAIAGGILGIPLSYFFQSEIIKAYDGGGGIFSYTKNFLKILKSYDKYIGNSWDIISNVLFSIIIFAILGGILGYFFKKRVDG